MLQQIAPGIPVLAVTGYVLVHGLARAHFNVSLKIKFKRRTRKE